MMIGSQINLLTKTKIISFSILQNQLEQESIMTVESLLTRELSIRFIDARKFATEAKLNLGVEGYPSKEQEDLVFAEAINIFRQRPEEVKTALRCLRSELDMVKSPFLASGSSVAADGSSMGSDDSSGDAGEDQSSITSLSLSSLSSKKRFRLFRRQ